MPPRRGTKAKPAPKKAKAAPAKSAKPAPPNGFRTIDYGDGMHGLMLVGPGYAWESIGRHFAAREGVSEHLKFDCEGGMFVVRSTDPAVLAKLKAKLDPVLANRDMFKKLVATLGEA